MTDRRRLCVALMGCAMGLAAASRTSAQTAAAAPNAPSVGAPTQESAPDAIWSLGGQATVVDQTNAGFRSAYQGAQSLRSGVNSRETVDATLFAGVRPWNGGEIWISPEIDQGFGLSNTSGVAGYLSGEAYKIGSGPPYVRLDRFFMRQTVDLGGKPDPQEAGPTNFAATPTHDRLVITLGKMSVGDVFDTNSYAHDPRNDFFNWALIDTGTFDYAADAWGYSYGATGEWYTGDWTFRLGGFNLSKVPNGANLNGNFSEFQVDEEVERRYRLFGQEGKLKLTAFENRGRMGDFADAVARGQADGSVPSVAAVRRYRGRAGISVNVEQPLAEDVGVFLRAGYADGHQQSYEFTDIDRTVAGGVSLQGKRWGRGDDTVGLALEVNDASEALRKYLAAGGLALLIGDGRLDHYGTERVVETYYNFAAVNYAHLTLDYQFVENPAYNKDRGPVSVIGLRLHLQGTASGR